MQINKAKKRTRYLHNAFDVQDTVYQFFVIIDVVKSLEEFDPILEILMEASRAYEHHILMYLVINLP